MDSFAICNLLINMDKTRFRGKITEYLLQKNCFSLDDFFKGVKPYGAYFAVVVPCISEKLRD